MWKLGLVEHTTALTLHMRPGCVDAGEGPRGLDHVLCSRAAPPDLRGIHLVEHLFQIHIIEKEKKKRKKKEKKRKTLLSREVDIFVQKKRICELRTPSATLTIFGH